MQYLNERSYCQRSGRTLSETPSIRTRPTAHNGNLSDEALARMLQEEEYSVLQPTDLQRVHAARDMLAALELAQFEAQRSGLTHPENYLDDDELDTSYEALLALGERIGDAKPKGLPREVINSLPAKRYKYRKGMSSEETTCTVCLVDYDDGDLLRGTPCAHWFHEECISKWLKDHRNCPM